MNRAQRRASAKAVRHATSGAGRIRLIGGPMADYLVGPEAACLKEWWGELTTGVKGSKYELGTQDGDAVALWREGEP